MLRKLFGLLKPNRENPVRRRIVFERLEDRILLAANLDVDKIVSGTSETDTTGTDVTIGETVTYEVTATVQEGVTNNVVLTDTLPDNIDFLAGTLTVTPNGPITTQFTSETYVGDVLELDFGTVTNIFDGDPTNDTITITFDAIVQNDAVNQNGNVKTNWVSITDGVITETASADVTIVEPELDISKVVTGGGSNIQVGETVEYRIVVSHDGTSGSSAFDIDLSDPLPAELEGMVLTGAWLSESGQPDVNVAGSFNITPAGLLETIGDVDILLSGVGGNPQSLTLTVTGSVAAGVPVATSINNQADLTWTSINGPSVAERDGGGGIDDYFTDDLASFDVASEPTRRGGGPPPPLDPEPPTFVYDVFRNDARAGDEILYEIPDMDYVLPGIPVAPLYTGTAIPGATLVVRLVDVEGRELAEDSVIAGSDGNWLISFPTAYIQDYPYGIEVTHESVPLGTRDVDNLGRLNLHYSPAPNVISSFKYSLTADWVFYTSPHRSLEIMHRMLTRPLL